MNPWAVGLIILVILAGFILAGRCFYLASPVGRGLTARYRTSARVQWIEELSPDDVFRTQPYRVDLLISGRRSGGEAGNPNIIRQEYEASVTSADLNPATARWAWRARKSLPVWVALDDPQDATFTPANRWDKPLIFRGLVLLAVSVITLVTTAFSYPVPFRGQSPQTLLYLGMVGALAAISVLGVSYLIRALIGRMNRLGTPLTAQARIDGVRQVTSLAGRMHQEFEVTLTYLPPDLPAQVGKVHLVGFERRSALLLRALIEQQITEESRGIVRAWRSPPPKPPRPTVRTIYTAQGPTQIRFTQLPPPGAGNAKGRGVKASRQTRRSRQVANRAQIRQSKAAAWTWGSGGMDEALRQVIKDGPMVWYYPTSPSVLHLMGISSGKGRGNGLAGPYALGWGLLMGAAAGVAIAALAYLGLNPGWIFPPDTTPPADKMLIGPWR